MTRSQAEEIYMANELGMFNGTRGELAIAILIISDDHLEEQEIPEKSENE